jgi:formamidopyrimidine-DNA glycosylase
MPEVCEVCLTAQYLSLIIGDNITKLEVTSGRYTKTPIKGLTNVKYPLKVVDIDTKGKFLWMTLQHNDDTYYLMNTFGLTGMWSFDELEHTHFVMTVKSNTKTYHVYFSDMRNFGTIEITTDKSKLEKKLTKLGDDLLKTKYSASDIQIRLDKLNQKKKIVEVMMSQEANKGIGSGLGNYLVPEILYRAKISPLRTVSSLTKHDVERLTDTMKTVLRLCYISNKTEYIEHLKSFLDKHSKKVSVGKFPDYHKSQKVGHEKFEFKVYGRKIDNLGNEVIGDKIITGRTTYWVPNVQK